ncbi:hypothetical protein [Catellatospora tritici]|uniref:hypothetical protein n=1 Tax=Catellatospora tritici TaxID=2851566 RepID=UPI001C2DEDEE|nr:hypothetical protein [Catellatospora tritici]MBV1850917.1 hypothetical protein [Catellatospora tritici]MBV1851170.1 hypothetical protein [Catellatospora tritici]
MIVAAILGAAVIVGGPALVADLGTGRRWLVVLGLLLAFTGLTLAGIRTADLRLFAGGGLAILIGTVALALTPPSVVALGNNTSKVTYRTGADRTDTLCGRISSKDADFLSITIMVEPTGPGAHEVDRNGDLVKHEVGVQLPIASLIVIEDVDSCE